MASGKLQPGRALSAGAAILALCLAASCIFFSHLFFLNLLSYFLLNVLYSLKFKEVAVLDICTIAMGFVLRATAGGLSIGVELTPWFLICALMLSLFLATGKRRYEYVLWKRSGVIPRRVMSQYSLELLNQLSSVTATCVILSYALFTLSSNHARSLMITIPIVIYGVMRYLKLVYSDGSGGKPELTLLEDKHIFITVVLFAVAVILVLKIWG